MLCVAKKTSPSHVSIIRNPFRACKEIQREMVDDGSKLNQNYELNVCFSFSVGFDGLGLQRQVDWSPAESMARWMNLWDGMGWQRCNYSSCQGSSYLVNETLLIMAAGGISIHCEKIINGAVYLNTYHTSPGYIELFFYRCWVRWIILILI